MKNKKTILIITAITLTNLLFSTMAGAATSTITISKTPYLSFVEIPDSIIINAAPLPVPIKNTFLFSDESTKLPKSRSLTIQDTRENGGFILQLEASEFYPQTPQETDLREEFRVVTSTSTEKYSDLISINGVFYFPSEGEEEFIGEKTVIAPLTAQGEFSDIQTFTSINNNTLENTVDLLNGCLETGGRKGKMNVHLSFNIEIPKFTPPPAVQDQYHSTLTFTLSDYTPTSCQ